MRFIPEGATTRGFCSLDPRVHLFVNPAQVGAESEGPGLGHFKIHAKAGDRVAFSLWAKLKLSYRPI
jgi:hypothetical protein